MYIYNQVGPGPGLGWIFVKPGPDLNPFWVFFLKPKLDPIFYRTGPGIRRSGKNCHLYQVIMFLKSTSSFCKLIKPNSYRFRVFKTLNDHRNRLTWHNPKGLGWFLKAQISVKTLKLVQTPKLKLRLDYFYFNLTKCGIRVNMCNKSVTLLLSHIQPQWTIKWKLKE